MLLKDKIDFYGEFTIKQLDKDGNVLNVYEEKNLIMDVARSNMAELIGGVTASALPINQFVIGNMGHVSTDILDYQQVGETDTTKPSGDQDFDSTRTDLFSEAITAGVNYRIPFDVSGGTDVTVQDANASGTRYIKNVAETTDMPEVSGNIVQRVVSDRTVTYTITIPVANANSGNVDPVVAYTEAGLYAGTDLFSMKTFPARVKEDTTQFEITWSIIF